MSTIRTSDEFFALVTAAQNERATVVAAQAAAKRLIRAATAEAHEVTVRAAKALLNAGGSEYMIGQATGMTGYVQRSRLAEEARNYLGEIQATPVSDDADGEAVTQQSVSVPAAEPGDKVEWDLDLAGDAEESKFAVYVIDKQGHKATYYLDLFEGDFYNGANPETGDVVDSVGILTELGIFEEVSRAIRG